MHPPRQTGPRGRAPRRVILALATLGLVACAGEPAAATGDGPSPGEGAGAGPGASPLPAWGGVVAPASTPALRAAELARGAGDPALAAGLSSPDERARRAAAWALGRVGGERAAATLLASLAGPGEVGPGVVAAAAALERPAPPEADPLAPPERSPEPDTWDRLERTLWTRYALAEDERVAEAALFALARIGGDLSVDLLAAELAGEADAATRADAALALSLVCARGLAMSEAALRAVSAALTDPDVAVARGALRALARCARSSPGRIDPAAAKTLAAAIEPRLVAPDHPLAPLGWRALAAVGGLPEEVPSYVLDASELGAGSDRGAAWRTQVEAARALGRTADGRRELARRLAALDPSQVTLPGTHALVEAVRALRGAPGELGAPGEAGPARLAQALAEALRETKGRRARELAWVACELEATLAAGRGGPAENKGASAKRAGPAVPGGVGAGEDDGTFAALGPACPRELVPPPLLASLEVEAVVRAAAGPERTARLLEWARSDDPLRAAPALAALADVADPGVAETLRRALASGDVGRVSAAAGAIALRAKEPRLRDRTLVEPLLAALAALRDEDAVEARIAALSALSAYARLARQEGAPPAWLDRLVPLATDPAVAVRRAARAALSVDPARLGAFEDAVPDGFEGAFAAAEDALDPGSRPPAELRLRLPGGVVRVDLAGVPAPMNQANLAHLAERGFFDGVALHRVVPGFVVQGGDPRGDGYGGPGYLVPCEWSNLRYTRGAVGIALAGKDTGGSQFFITQAATPHLDGRYTLVGYVTDGMEVVDRMMPFDAIQGVEVVRR